MHYILEIKHLPVSLSMEQYFLRWAGDFSCSLSDIWYHGLLLAKKFRTDVLYFAVGIGANLTFVIGETTRFFVRNTFICGIYFLYRILLYCLNIINILLNSDP